MPRKPTGKPTGRPPGSTNKQPLDVKEAAKEFTADALNTLACIMRDEAQPAAARVSAAGHILDRGHGKPKQSLDVEADVTARVTRTERVIVDPKPTDPNSADLPAAS
jgi:hypothetical protein